MVKVQNISDIPVQATPLGGVSRMLVDQPELRLVNLLLKAGETVGEHVAEVEVVFIIQKGSGLISAGGETAAFGAGQILVCPAGLIRSMTAGLEGTDIMVIRAPNK